MKKRNKSDATVLVCMRANAPIVVPGSIFDRRCGKCGERVIIAPSGQRLLARKALKIHCWPCYRQAAEKGEVETVGFAANADEIRRETRSGVPNFWSTRN